MTLSAVAFTAICAVLACGARCADAFSAAPRANFITNIMTETTRISGTCALRPSPPRRTIALEVSAGDDDDMAASVDGDAGRRSFLARALAAAAAATGPFSSAAIAAADDDSSDLTSRLFNPDGSLKEGAVAEGVTGEAKTRTVSVVFPSDPPSGGSALISTDGAAPSGGSGGESVVKVSYNLPEKWGTDPSNLYFDKSEGVNARACDRITVYQVPGAFKSAKVLDKAATTGVAKALGVVTTGEGYYNPGLLKADLVGGRTDGRDGRRYYDFDLASAPASCGKSSDNLGLGFCPYDSIVLFSATIVGESMYVCMVECDKDEWKRANSDLKRVRESFMVEDSS